MLTHCSGIFQLVMYTNINFQPILCYCQILYSGETFEAENFRELVEFRGENFRRLLTCAAPKDAMSPNFMEKTFVNSHKTSKFVKCFPLKVSCYRILKGGELLLITEAFCQNVSKSFWFGGRAPSFCLYRFQLKALLCKYRKYWTSVMSKLD